jgi:hypothetical protein
MTCQVTAGRSRMDGDRARSGGTAPRHQGALLASVDQQIAASGLGLVPTVQLRAGVELAGPAVRAASIRTLNMY